MTVITLISSSPRVRNQVCSIFVAAHVQFPQLSFLALSHSLGIPLFTHNGKDPYLKQN